MADALQLEPVERLRQPVDCHRARRRMGTAVSYTHLRAHETPEHLVCRLLLEKKKKKKKQKKKKKKKKKKKRKKRKILCFVVCFFFFNDTATTEIYT